MSKRIEYIDIAKGIGILLVVLGHNDFGYISPYAYHVIYSFHMPLFFFLSGYFLKTNIPFLEFAKKRFNSLMKPYLFTLFIIYATSVSFEKMSFRTALQRIVKSLYGTGHYIDWVQLWFLPNLFVAALYAFIFFAIMSRWDNRYVRWIVLLATLGVASLFLKTFYPFSISVFGKQYELYGLPFSLDLVLLSGFFFILGSEIRQITSEKTFDNLYLLISTGVSLLALNYIFPQRIDFNTRTYESFPLNTVEAIIGIFFVLALSRQIELRTSRLAALFRYFGEITLFLLIFHVPIQDYWSQKVFALIANQKLSIWVGFFMGVGGSVLIYELFIKENPVALYWFGRIKQLPAKKEAAPISGTMQTEDVVGRKE